MFYATILILCAGCRVTDNEEVNAMHAANLSIIFAP